LVRATRSHAANYAATDKMRQVGQQPSNKRFAGSSENRIESLLAPRDRGATFPPVYRDGGASLWRIFAKRGRDRIGHVNWRLAQGIIVAQQQEIELMERYLHKGSAPEQ
jgi:hypothetical protein